MIYDSQKPTRSDPYQILMQALYLTSLIAWLNYRFRRAEYNRLEVRAFHYETFGEHARS